MRSPCRNTTAANAVGHDVECDSKRCSVTSTAAVHADRGVMKIDNVLCNGQTEAESAELTRDQYISLLERLKEGGLPFGVDANSGIGNLEDEMISLVVRCANFDAAVASRELGSITNEIPKHLLDAYSIGPDVVFVGGKGGGNFQSLSRNVLL